MPTTTPQGQQRWLVLAAACLSCLALTAAQPVDQRPSFLGQLMPFGTEELNEFFRQTGGVVDAMSQGTSYAFEEVTNSFEGLANSLTGAGTNNNRHPHNEIIDYEDVDCQPGNDSEWCPPYDPDAKRNVSQIIESRGFRGHDLEVTTRDGYILTIQRIINPEVSEKDRKQLKPVILQHGLMSSSADWVINSVDVRPARWPRLINKKQTGAGNSIEEHQRALGNLDKLQDSQHAPNALGFYLANEGYDVFLANSRGNIYGQKHVNLSSWQPKFWDFTFDEQIKYDLPDVIAYVQRLTGHTKVGYVGHSQGTTMALGLLADQPDYADVLEPVVLLAPVAYVNHCLSPVKYFAVYTPIFQHVNMWFTSSNAAVRYLAPKVCSPKLIRKEICANIIFLSCGFDEAEFNETRTSAYLSHMPSGTSVKNIAHWGQEVLSGRFAHFDHGILGNQVRYGSHKNPDYDLTKIRSKSISLFTAENDWLASPKDVARLKRELPQAPFKVVNVTEFMPAWNHIDFVYGKDSGQLVNTRIVDIFHHFD